VVEAGDLVIAVGTVASTQPDGSRDIGKVMAVLQLGDDGRWRVHRVMWNTDLPAR
jgi:ketosteroid isomerase-like protein